MAMMHSEPPRQPAAAAAEEPAAAAAEEPSAEEICEHCASAECDSVTHVEAMSGGEKRWSEAAGEYCRRVPPRLTSSSAGKTTPPSSPRHR